MFTKGSLFSLERPTKLRHIAHTQAQEILSDLPERCETGGGTQRFSRVNCWEGSRSALGRELGCPGVAASLEGLLTRHDRAAVVHDDCGSGDPQMRAETHALGSVVKAEGAPLLLKRWKARQNNLRDRCGPGGWPGPHSFFRLQASGCRLPLTSVLFPVSLLSLRWEH